MPLQKEKPAERNFLAGIAATLEKQTIATPPLYSIVIPTRERHDVLEACLATVPQTVAHFEVVVMDNCSSADTKAVVDRAAAACPQIKYFRAPERLAMTDNWELGLSHAQGDYVFFLGDDDALFPDTVATAAHLHAAHPGALVSWKPSVWWWPEVVVPEYRNWLHFHVSDRVEVRRSRESLRRLYAGECDYSDLPGIYNGFVPRAVIEKVRDRFGKYFISTIPDVSSAIVNAHLEETHLFTYRPLVLDAGSHHSTGISQTFRHFSNKSAETFDEENKKGASDEEFDPALRVDTGVTLELIIANVLLKMKTLLFPDDDGLQLSYEGLVDRMCGAITRYAADYDRVVDLTRLIAERNGVPESRLVFPKREEITLEIQPYHNAIDAHCTQYGTFTNPDTTRDVADTARFLRSLLCPVEGLKLVDAT